LKEDVIMKAKFSLILVMLALACMVAFACSSENSTGTDGDVIVDGDLADGDVPVDGDTQPDGDLPPDGDKPDGDGGVIIDPTDGDEDEGRQDGCLSDRDCFGDEYCDTASKLCKRRKTTCEPCEKSEECGYREDLCLPEGICGRWCQSMTDCPEGFNCEQIQGLTEKQCVFNASSGDGSMGAKCCYDGNCQEPMVCHPQTNRCYDGCIGDGSSACPPGEVCVDPSDDNRNGHCAPGCDETMPCAAGTVCIDGTCIEGDCALKEHCPLEYLCETDTRHCVPGCEDNGDCYAYNECIEGLCVERIGCEGTYQCGLGEMCTEELEEMNVPPEDRGCCFDPKTSGSEECANPYPEGPQKFCDACTDEQNQNKECGEDDVCAELKGKDENDNEISLGFFCLIRWDCSLWTDDGRDEGTRECPRGYGCIKIEDGQMAGKYCMADCTNPLFSE
jgi:hypothetical protein